MSASTRLSGIAVVTGAASGIGQATAVAIVNAGIDGIALIDRNSAGLEDTRNRLIQLKPKISKLPTIRLYTCDVTSADNVDQTYTQIQTDFKRIDYSCHCAGIIIFHGPTHTVPVTDYELLTSVNARGLWLCQRSALRVMRTQSLTSDAYPDSQIPPSRAQRGSIVNISSIGALASPSNSAAYCSSKAATLALTRSDALDYAVDRVRVNAVVPGFIDTPMANTDAEKRRKLEEMVVSGTPMARFGTAEEVADVVVFLCGSGASFVTGVGWVVDGGWMTQ